MVQVLNAPPKAFSWSYSKVDNFHTCPKLYYHRSVVKDVSDDTTYRTEGQAVHNLLKDRVLHARELPAHLRHWDRWADEILTDCDRTKVLLQAERKMAFTEKFLPCGYFDKTVPVWCRLQLDVLKVNGDLAKVWDWKTGKVKPDNEQLMIYATGVFVHYPTVKNVHAALVFLKQDTGPHVPRNDCTYELLIDMDDVEEFWGTYKHKVRAVQKAELTNNFPANPSGLCRAHCPVVSCPHNGNYV